MPPAPCPRHQHLRRHRTESDARISAVDLEHRGPPKGPEAPEQHSDVAPGAHGNPISRETQLTNLILVSELAH